MQISLRLTFYISFMLIYLVFMDQHTAGGIGWVDYHAYRIFNAVEYLRLNGYLSQYGYSTWTSCSDCDLRSDHWQGEIYISAHALINLLPYILVNDFFGKSALHFWGPIIDKTVIFITAVFVAESFIRFVGQPAISKGSISSDRQSPPIPSWWLGLSVFSLFITSIWAYQMQRAMWNEIWFLLFFGLSLSALLRNKFLLGCALVFVAGLMHYLSGFILALVLLAFSIFSKIYGERPVFMLFLPRVLYQQRRLWLYSLCALIPAFIHLGLRMLYTAASGQVGQGSSLLFRIGIAGNDIHNGGIIGALQFLGGVRVSQCISMLGLEGLQGASLMPKISAFNCALSILGMFLLSALSVLGVIWLLRTKPSTRLLLFPTAMILLITVAVLQQSFSVHLLGHSYSFALLFACGLVGLCLKGAEVINSRALSLIVFTPIIIACVLLSIRVSMLSGVPG